MPDCIRRDTLRRRCGLPLAFGAGTAFAAPESLTLQIAGHTPAQAAVLARIAERRFDTLAPGPFAGVSARADGARIVLSFTG